MSDVLLLGGVGIATGLVGALAGAMLAGRIQGARLAAAVAAEVRAALALHLPAGGGGVGAEGTNPVRPRDAADVGPMQQCLEMLLLRVESLVEEHSLGLLQAQQQLEETQQGLPKQVHHVVQAEFEYQIQRLIDSHDATTQLYRRWFTEQEERLRSLLQPSLLPSVTPAPVLKKAPSVPKRAPAAVSVAVPEAPDELAALSDEEIDALPADLPQSDLRRKRVMAAPRKPTLSQL